MRHTFWRVLLLTLLLTLCLAACTCALADTRLTLGKTVPFPSTAGDEHTFTFTPTETGMYTFESFCSMEEEGLDDDYYPSCYLYFDDPEYGEEEIGSVSGYPNFILSEKLTANVKYYYTVSFDWDDYASSFSFRLRKSDGVFCYAEDESEIWVSVFGETAEMKVEASSWHTPLTYQWYKGVIDEDALADNSVPEQYRIDGATSAAYAPVIEDADDLGIYACIVVDNAGNSSYAEFIVRYNNHLVAEAKGGSEIYVAPGGSTTLSVWARSDAGELTYQWYGENGSISGATGASYAVSNVTEDTYYECHVTDMYDNSAYISFYVYVDHQLTVSPVGATDRTVAPGATVTLAVDASALDANLYYNWFIYRFYDEDDDDYDDDYDDDDYDDDDYDDDDYDDDDYDDDDEDDEGYWELISGANAASYTVGPVDRAAHYVCTVSTYYDSYPEYDGSYAGDPIAEEGSTAAVRFNISVENGFSVAPVGETDRLAAPGTKQTLKVNAQAADPDGLTYAWRYGYTGNGYEDWDDIEWHTLSSATTDTVTTVKLSAGKYTYECTVQDEYRNTGKVTYEITVGSGLEIETDEETFLSVPYGGKATLNVVAHVEFGTLTYKWYVYDEKVDDYVAVTGSKPTFTTPAIKTETSYLCRVKDSYGDDWYLYFAINVDNDLTIQPSGTQYVTVAPGDLAVLKVTASCARGNLRYEWSTDDGEVLNTTSNTLITPPVYEAKRYYCAVIDSFDNWVEVDFKVSPEAGPFSVEREGEQERHLSAGETTTLKVNATSSKPISYQWYRNFESLAGERDDTLEVSAEDGAGYYSCDVISGDRVFDDGYYEDSDSVSIGFLCLTDDSALTVGETRALQSRNGRAALLYFVPEQSGFYNLRSDRGARCTLYEIYNSNWHEIVEDGDNESGGNAFSITQPLVAGNPYYFIVSIGNGYNGGVGRTNVTFTAETRKAITLRTGQRVTLPEGGSSITSNSNRIVDVSGGVITAKSRGTCELTVVTDEGVILYDVTVRNAAYLNRLKLPAGLKTIESRAFANNEYLTAVTLGAQVQSVGARAFSGTALEMVVVESMDTTFDPDALDGTYPTIVCRPGSAAAAFAEANGFTYVYQQ